MKSLPLALTICLFTLSTCKKDVVLVNDTGAVFYCQTAPIAPGLEIGEIYHSKNFAAFTDLAYYNDLWYATFRVGTSHANGVNGQIKILTSKDGVIWNVEKIFAISGFDLRDSKFVIDSLNNTLYLNFWGRKQMRWGQIIRQNYLVKYNGSSKSWGPVDEIKYDHSFGDFIFWRLTYFKGKMYSVAYHSPVLNNDNPYPDNNIYLFISNQTFTNYQIVGKIFLTGGPNETTVRFDEKDSMYLVVRTERTNSPIGISFPSDYKKVQWIKNPLSTVLASPNFLFYKDKMLITGRDSKEGTFKFFSYNIKSRVIEKKYTFPSGHETGYGGMSFNPSNENELWITYYSIVDTASSINLAKIDLLKFLN